MEIDPAAGKILGMIMAYGVSALGLLLAYYNYRKRIVKADRIFTAKARMILAAAGGTGVALLVLGAAAMDSGAGPWEAIRLRAAGILIPALIFAFSFCLTWWLYQRFSRR